MKRFFRWLTRVTAFRIGLVTGLAFAALRVWQFGNRSEDSTPLLSRMESALVDARFQQRQRLLPVHPSGRVVIAAVDEPAIAKFGRFPWDRRVIASLIDKLTEQGVTAIGFDMTFSDEDLGAKFAGAKRFRKRFEDISLASPRNHAAVEHFAEAESDIAGAASALATLGHEVKPDAEPIYQAARGRLDDGAQKLKASRQQFEDLSKEHEEYANELDHDLVGFDPDKVMGASVGKAAGKVVLGWIALTQPEMQDFKESEAEDNLKRIDKARLHDPEFQFKLSDNTPGAQPVKKSWLKWYAGLRAPLPPIAANARWFGFFNTTPDDDGVIRHEALAMQIGGRIFPSLDLAMFAIAEGIKPQDITPVTTNVEDGDIDHVAVGDKIDVPTDSRGLMAINYVGSKKAAAFEHDSIADIMDGKFDGKLKDKLVFVAATAEGTFDQRVTPLDKITPGVETHANALETLLSQRFLVRGPLVQSVEIGVLLLLAFAFAFVFTRVKVNYALPVLGISIVAMWGVATLLFQKGWNFFAAMPLLELGAMFVLVTVYRYATEEKDKRQLRKAFQLYLNPEVMEEMLEDPQALQLGGKELEMTVMFSDIRGFTTISEKLSPQGLVHLLNAYLSPMTDIVFEKRGTLDKYIGDAVMAFFGAPVQTELHAANGCDAALQMMETLGRLREKWRIEDPDVPDIDIGIGLNSGPMVVGNMGSSQRFNYTVMGDNVNLASRLEGLNKEYGTHILVSEATLQAARKGLKDENAYCVRELDFVSVKGKKEPVRLFELRSRGPAKTEELPLLEGWTEGLKLYRSQKFAEARLTFESLQQRFPDDAPTRKMIAHIDEMSENPPGENWDGVRKMTHK